LHNYSARVPPPQFTLPEWRDKSSIGFLNGWADIPEHPVVATGTVNRMDPDTAFEVYFPDDFGCPVLGFSISGQTMATDPLPIAQLYVTLSDSSQLTLPDAVNRTGPVCCQMMQVAFPPNEIFPYAVWTWPLQDPEFDDQVGCIWQYSANAQPPDFGGVSIMALACSFESPPGENYDVAICTLYQS
jgi:hypothetical protein